MLSPRRILAGMTLSPACWAARQRRSPAMISQGGSFSVDALASSCMTGRTRIGCRTPCWAIESASSLIASATKALRGWRGSGAISPSGKSRYSSAEPSADISGLLLWNVPRVLDLDLDLFEASGSVLLAVDLPAQAGKALAAGGDGERVVGDHGDVFDRRRGLVLLRRVGVEAHRVGRSSDLVQRAQGLRQALAQLVLAQLGGGVALNGEAGVSHDRPPVLSCASLPAPPAQQPARRRYRRSPAGWRQRRSPGAASAAAFRRQRRLK